MLSAFPFYLLPEYFGYNYYDNVDLLPDEFRKYVYPRYFDEYVVPEAKYYKIEPNFVYSIMREESLFDVKAKSYVGAMGLMQLMPTTAAAENKKARYRYNPLNLTDAKQNIKIIDSNVMMIYKYRVMDKIFEEMYGDSKFDKLIQDFCLEPERFLFLNLFLE